MRRRPGGRPPRCPELVERFSHDPEAPVRARAAGDPRLSPESAARLAGDACSSVRFSAYQNPALPPATLVPLLLDYRHGAGDAVRNPGIPVPVLRRMARSAVR
ncbi:hypothetical protein ABT354_36270 [Streptomyces sp. NPDC000594]|uniref:hypothetical protein n=1 Tax=Streptomyces sp. NPDC000594 TaxID=3154261 RepID=UPI00331AC72E